MQGLTPQELETVREASAALHPVVTLLIASVFAALTTIALVYVRRAIAAFEKATGIKLSAEQRATVESVVTTSLLATEEHAQKYAEQKLRGIDKMQHAERVARELDPEATAHLDSEQFQTIAEAKLQSLRPWMATRSSVTGKSIPPAGMFSIPPAPAVAALASPLPPRDAPRDSLIPDPSAKRPKVGG